MSFAYPWLLLLLPIPAVVSYLSRRGSAGLAVPSLQLWDHTSEGRSRYLWIPRFCRVIAMTLLVFALARPQAGSTHSTQVSEGIAIELLVDVSSSMGMNMEIPNEKKKTRMEVAKELVERFIAGDGEQLKGRDGDLIGLVTFARYADTRSPLTLGHDALLQLVRTLDIQQRPNEDGTAYGDALAVAAARLQQLDDPEVRQRRSLEGEIASRVIVLLTDGENNSGQHLPVEAAGLAQQWGCRVYCISLGERPSGLGAVKASSLESSTVATQLSEAERVLEHISLETGGRFRVATDYDSLLAIYAEIDQLEKARVVTKSYSRVRECFGMPLAIAIGLLLMPMILDATWLRTVP